MKRRNTKRRKPQAIERIEPAHIALARRLVVLADCELQHGHVAAAENLSRRAEALRAVEFA